jgi:hypothetical protein
MIFCSAGASVTAEEKKPANAIRVLEATYGGNCTGVAKGNVTKFIASACDGTDLCNYRVYYKNMGGDPAAECKKAFRVTYVCGKNTKPQTCTLEAEAGKGGDDGEANNFCLLHCLSEGTRERRKARPKEEGARRAAVAPHSLLQQPHQIPSHHHHRGNGGEPRPRCQAEVSSAFVSPR